MSLISIISCDQIDADPEFNVCREHLTPADCEDLAASIEVQGLQTPVTVRPVEGEKPYQLVVGFRRFMACSVNLGLEKIPAFVREMTEQEARILNVIENLQRKDLSYWGECRAVKAAFPDDTNYTEIARQLGVSTTWVTKRKRVWELPESILLEVQAGILSPAQVDIIIQQDEKDRIRAANRLKAGKARGEAIRDIQRTLTGRKNNRSKKQIKKVMTQCLESGTTVDQAAVEAFRFATGEISDTLFFELLDKLRSV